MEKRIKKKKKKKLTDKLRHTICCIQSLPKDFKEASSDYWHTSTAQDLADKEIGKKSIILWEIFSKQVPKLFPAHQGFHLVSFI